MAIISFKSKHTETEPMDAYVCRVIGSINDYYKSIGDGARLYYIVMDNGNYGTKCAVSLAHKNDTELDAHFINCASEVYDHDDMLIDIAKIVGITTIIQANDLQNNEDKFVDISI